MTFSVPSTTFLVNKDYFLIRPLQNIPKVVEFFSFYCPYCYQLEICNKKNNIFNKNSLNNMNIRHYHVIFNNNFDLSITQAWSIAIALNIENKVILPIFSGIQKVHTIYNKKTLKKTFIQYSDISPQMYDTLWDSLLIKKILLKQIQTSQLIQLKEIPTICINGKYVINNNIHLKSILEFIKSYTVVTNYLLNIKELKIVKK
ncbi:DsbA family protein [Buchnera aphidicola]|uniref:DsbA family protein n=1 Tax=Buchnera aphidicola TaxID=9 RepID=UPI001359737D|nr:DsbA family protein [Buchnera aphidicola]